MNVYSEISDIIYSNGGSSNFRKVMLGHYSKWSEFSYDFWDNTFDLIKDKPLALYAYIPFTYKLLGINFLPKFNLLEGVSKETREYVNDAIGEEHRLLHISNADLVIIERSDKKMFINLIEISKKLWNQGATKVEVFKYSEAEKIYELNREDFYIKCDLLGCEATIKELLKST